jgi:hypothetical protein
MITVRYGLWYAFTEAVRFEGPRPYLPVTLHGPNYEIYVTGLVDSGADSALFNAGYALLLGLDLKAGRHGWTRDVGGRVECWTHSVEMTIFGKRFAAEVDFSEDWGPEFGLLGMHDLFRAFLVAIDQPGQRVLLEPVP